MFGGFGDRGCLCHQACVDSMPAVKSSNYKKILIRRDRFFKTGFSMVRVCRVRLYRCAGVVAVNP